MTSLPDLCAGARVHLDVKVAPRQEYGAGGRWPPVVDMVFLSHDYVRSHFPKDANMLT